MKKTLAIATITLATLSSEAHGAPALQNTCPLPLPDTHHKPLPPELWTQHFKCLTAESKHFQEHPTAAILARNHHNNILYHYTLDLAEEIPLVPSTLVARAIENFIPTSPHLLHYTEEARKSLKQLADAIQKPLPTATKLNTLDETIKSTLAIENELLALTTSEAATEKEKTLAHRTIHRARRARAKAILATLRSVEQATADENKKLDELALRLNDLTRQLAPRIITTSTTGGEEARERASALTIEDLDTRLEEALSDTNKSEKEILENIAEIQLVSELSITIATRLGVIDAPQAATISRATTAATTLARVAATISRLNSQEAAAAAYISPYLLAALVVIDLFSDHSSGQPPTLKILQRISKQIAKFQESVTRQLEDIRSSIAEEHYQILRELANVRIEQAELRADIEKLTRNVEEMRRTQIAKENEEALANVRAYLNELADTDKLCNKLDVGDEHLFRCVNRYVALARSFRDNANTALLQLDEASGLSGLDARISYSTAHVASALAKVADVKTEATHPLVQTVVQRLSSLRTRLPETTDSFLLADLDSQTETLGEMAKRQSELEKRLNDVALIAKIENEHQNDREALKRYLSRIADNISETVVLNDASRIRRHTTTGLLSYGPATVNIKHNTLKEKYRLHRQAALEPAPMSTFTEPLAGALEKQHIWIHPCKDSDPYPPFSYPLMEATKHSEALASALAAGAADGRPQTRVCYSVNTRRPESVRLDHRKKHRGEERTLVSFLQNSFSYPNHKDLGIADFCLRNSNSSALRVEIDNYNRRHRNFVTIDDVKCTSYEFRYTIRSAKQSVASFAFHTEVSLPGHDPSKYVQKDVVVGVEQLFSSRASKALGTNNAKFGRCYLYSDGLDAGMSILAPLEFFFGQDLSVHCLGVDDAFGKVAKDLFEGAERELKLSRGWRVQPRSPEPVAAIDALQSATVLRRRDNYTALFRELRDATSSDPKARALAERLDAAAYLLEASAGVRGVGGSRRARPDDVARDVLGERGVGAVVD